MPLSIASCGPFSACRGDPCGVPMVGGRLILNEGPVSHAAVPSPLAARAGWAAQGPPARARRQVDLPSRPDLRRAGGRGDPDFRASRGRGRAQHRQGHAGARGARSSAPARAQWRVHGVGVGGFRQPQGVLDFGNSATGCRLVMGAVAGCPITDDLRRRRLAAQAADAAHPRPGDADGRPGGRHGRGRPAAGHHRGRARSDPDRLPHAGAVGADQVGGAARGAGGARARPPSSRPRRAATTPRSCSRISAPTSPSTPDGAHGRKITLKGEPELVPAPVVVPADPSSAAFPMVAALIVPGSEVILTDVMTNPLRTGLITTLREMGADIETLNLRSDVGEEMADFRVRASALQGRRRAGRARAVDDRRISDPGGGGGLRRRHHAHARPEGIARQGIRPARGRRRRARRPTASRSRSRATT